jgi:hypothetical protein
MAWCPHCVQDRPIQRQILDFCSHCHCGTDMNHESWCRGAVPNAVDVCSYCHTHVFARALDATEFGRLLAAEEQGQKEAEIKRQQFFEWAKRRDAKRRSRNINLLIAGIVAGLVVLLVLAALYSSC